MFPTCSNSSPAKMPKTIIELMRHGEPEGGRLYRGNRIDDPLSESGWRQMRSIVPDKPAWQRVVSSPMLRCRDFAEEVSGRFNLPLEIEFDLREVGFGSWEGRMPDEIKRTDQEGYDRFYRDPVNNRPDGAEPLQDFYQRSVDSVERLMRQYPGDHLLAVTHAGVMRAVATWLMKAPLASMYRLRINYATVYRVIAESGRLRIEF